MSSVKSDLPLIPLRDVVVFPGIVTTLFVGRAKSVEALNIAMSSNKKLVLVSQKDASNEDPDAQDIFQYGSISNLLQLIKLPDGTMKYNHDAESYMTKGTAKVILDVVNGEHRSEVANLTLESFQALGIKELLTMQRQVGFASLIERVIRIAHDG